jgi:hypothetical protein
MLSATQVTYRWSDMSVKVYYSGSYGLGAEFYHTYRWSDMSVKVYYSGSYGLGAEFYHSVGK